MILEKSGIKAPYIKKVYPSFRLKISIAKLDGVENQTGYSLREDYGDSNKIVRDKFYDFFARATKVGELKLDIEELNKNLTIRIDSLPDSGKISEMFEKLNSKVSMSSKGKKNWSEEETIFFIWLVLANSEINGTNLTDLVINKFTKAE